MMRKTVIFLLAVMFCAVIVTSNPAYGGQQNADNRKTTQLTQAPDDANQTPTGTPKIFYPETIYDFGPVNQGDKVSHKFIVKNVGDAPLKLIKAKGS
jgi:hypothetical protein